MLIRALRWPASAPPDSPGLRASRLRLTLSDRPTLPAERASVDLLVLVLLWVALLLVLLGLREEDEDELDLGRGRLALEDEDEETLATGYLRSERFLLLL